MQCIFTLFHSDYVDSSHYSFVIFPPQVVEQGMFVKHCKVEVYLTELKLCEDSNMDNVITRRFSKADTIGRPKSLWTNCVFTAAHHFSGLKGAPLLYIYPFV